MDKRKLSMNFCIGSIIILGINVITGLLLFLGLSDFIGDNYIWSTKWFIILVAFLFLGNEAIVIYTKRMTFITDRKANNFWEFILDNIYALLVYSMISSLFITSLNTYKVIVMQFGNILKWIGQVIWNVLSSITEFIQWIVTNFPKVAGVIGIVVVAIMIKYWIYRIHKKE